MLTPAPCDIRPGSRSCSLWYPAGRLGHRERSFEWIANQIQLLIDNDGFPEPLALYDTAQRKVDRITPKSRWNVDAVDAWFDGTVPAHLTEAHQSRLVSMHAAQLDANAAALSGASA